MKKIMIVVIYFILFFPFIVKADLTMEQEEAIASFAEKLVIKQSMAPHVDDRGFPLIAYDMGSSDRIKGYNGQLIRFGYDAKRINKINANKWPFDCSSWASYVYKHVLGVRTTIGGGTRPLTVSRFLSNALNGVDFYVIARNVSVNNIGSAKKGDLLIIEGVHIMVYIGDGKISHVSTSAISKGGSLGAEVVPLQARYPGHTITIIRLKGTNAKPNTILTWPDTGKKEDLGPRDDSPTIKVEYKNDSYKKEGMAQITFSDDRMISQYSVSSKQGIYNWQNVNKQNYAINYVVKSNGTYYVSVKDSNNQIINTSFVVSNIDDNPPVIKKVDYFYNGDETYDVTITCEDVTNISYTLDNVSYNSNNVFKNLSLEKHNLMVRDAADNIVNYTIDLTAPNVPLFDVSFGDNQQKKAVVSIIPKDESNIAFYTVKKTSEVPLGWTVYTKDLKVDVNQNDTYYIWLKSNNNILYYKKIVIDNIDAIPPVIQNYKIDSMSNDRYMITINATDACGLEYSIVNGGYQKSNIFTNLEKNDYIFLIRDCAYNVSILNINSNEFISNNEPVKDDNDYSEGSDSSFIDTLLIIMIIIVSLIIIFNIFIIFKSRKKY